MWFTENNVLASEHAWRQSSTDPASVVMPREVLRGQSLIEANFEPLAGCFYLTTKALAVSVALWRQCDTNLLLMTWSRGTLLTQLLKFMETFWVALSTQTGGVIALMRYSHSLPGPFMNKLGLKLNENRTVSAWYGSNAYTANFAGGKWNLPLFCRAEIRASFD